MKKWIGPFLSLLLVVAMVWIAGPFRIDKEGSSDRKSKVTAPVYTAQGGERREETEDHFIQVLRQIQEKLEDWLKSLNERIESEDITRLEVRFLEILRSILEWVKEKVDAKIDSSDQERKEKKERKGWFRET